MISSKIFHCVCTVDHYGAWLHYYHLHVKKSTFLMRFWCSVSVYYMYVHVYIRIYSAIYDHWKKTIIFISCSYWDDMQLLIFSLIYNCFHIKQISSVLPSMFILSLINNYLLIKLNMDTEGKARHSQNCIYVFLL